MPRFDPDLADLEARDAQDRVWGLIAREIAVADGADIAHDMGKVATVRIEARQAHFGCDAGQGGCVHGNAADILPGHAFGDGDRQEGRAALHLGQRAVQLVLVKFDQGRQARDHFVDVSRVLAHHRDPVGRFVGGQDRAVAVEDLPACGWDQADVDPVLFGQEAECVSLIDLQVLHPQAKRACEGQLHTAKDHAAARDFADAFRGILWRSSHCVRPKRSMSPGALRRTPNRKYDTPTTTG